MNNDSITNMPFSTEEFLNVFGRYNTDVWPIQILFYVLALTCLAMLFSNDPRSEPLIHGILSFFWLWMGIVYHIIYFSPINPAAIGFGALFILQGVLFAFKGMSSSPLRFRPKKGIRSIIGVAFIFYALVVYPLLSRLFGHHYPEMPTFGLPCPTTIFTLGMFMFCRAGMRWYMAVVPLLWSLTGVFAAVHLSVRQDYFLGLAGILTIVLLFPGRRQQAKAVDSVLKHN